MFHEDEEPMNCLECGVSADDENTGIWTAMWADGGRKFAGMVCGGHE